MQIPNKFDPIALKDLMNFPYKENLFAYYYKGKFYLAPNRSYDELDTIPPGITIILNSIDNNTEARLIFGDGKHKCIQGVARIPQVNHDCFYASGGRRTAGAIQGRLTLKNAIFGGGSTDYYYGYYPKNYNLGFTPGWHDNGTYEKNSVSNIKFGCCFDRKLSKAEFDEVARWILRAQP